MSGRLYFMVGLPRSGKSSTAQLWLKGPFLPDPEGERPGHIKFNYLTDGIEVVRPRAVVSGDDFRKAVHGHSYIAEAEGLVFSYMDVAIKALLLGGFDVLVDETSTTESTIMRYLRADLDAVPIWIDTPVDECIQRARATNKEFLIGPIYRISRQMDELRKGWPDNFQRMRDQVRYRKESDNAVV